MTLSGLLLLSLAVLGLAACEAGPREAPSPTQTATPPPPTATPPPITADSVRGFAGGPVIAGLPQPMDFTFADDGRIFVASKEGAVRIVSAGALLPEPFIRLPVSTLGDRGLTAIALDPEFEENGYVYLYYTYENDSAKPTAAKTGRLIRVTSDGDKAAPGSEVVLLGSIVGDALHPSCHDFPEGADCIPMDGFAHFGGGLRFGLDGTLFVSTGDASHFTPDPDGLRLPVQDLDSLAGKILRINTDGTAPGDNPFFDGDSSANRAKVWAYGLRNPYRFGIRPGSGMPFIGDVGSDYWDEIDAGPAGSNFGWPCYEGAERHPDQSALPACQDLFARGVAVAAPVYAYAISEGAAIIGGVFYEGGDYPPEFDGAYFFADWARGTVSVLRVDGNNELVPGSVLVVLDDGGQPIDFELGPSGDVYYLALDLEAGTGEIRRLTHTPGTQAGSP
ncbi:MAG: PQQ-dependent sugar dehydrogenase [Dehalococcoidia bacterium]